ncbi:MAG: 6-carboxytetrahydropterin synthase [Alistipes sp.]|nr:6-carboxytetrahydropterin synthase [Alistipes sp.]
MSVIRLTKEFSFEAAHALEGYDGRCREIHGHSYRLYITIKGEPINDPDSPKYGMVMDFGALKRIVNEQIIDRLDHSFMMRRTPEAEQIAAEIGSRFQRVILTDYQPTTENLLSDFAERLLGALPEDVELCKLKLHETATSFGEWYASDNF